MENNDIVLNRLLSLEKKLQREYYVDVSVSRSDSVVTETPLLPGGVNSNPLAADSNPLSADSNLLAADPDGSGSEDDRASEQYDESSLFSVATYATAAEIVDEAQSVGEQPAELCSLDSAAAPRPHDSAAPRPPRLLRRRTVQIEEPAVVDLSTADEARLDDLGLEDQRLIERMNRARALKQREFQQQVSIADVAAADTACRVLMSEVTQTFNTLNMEVGCYAEETMSRMAAVSELINSPAEIDIDKLEACVGKSIKCAKAVTDVQKIILGEIQPKLALFRQNYEKMTEFFNVMRRLMAGPSS